MVAWARTAAATATIEAAAIGMGKVAVVDPTYANTKATVVELHGDFEDETERAALLVEAVLEHRARIHHRLSVKEKLDEERAKIEDEIRLGLRCEIPIESNLMNMVMGHKGSRVRAAQEACAVGAIVVDRDAGVIRVVGSDPAEVRKARAMLELRREVIQTPDDKTRRILIGKGGKNIDDIQRRSGAMSIDVDHDKGRVVVLGNASATAAARVLIESHAATMADLDAAADDLEELRGEIRNLNVAWGEEEEVSYGQGRRVRRARGRGEGVTRRGARRQSRRIPGRWPRRRQRRRQPRRGGDFAVSRRERADAFRRQGRPRRPRRPRRRAPVLARAQACAGSPRGEERCALAEAGQKSSRRRGEEEISARAQRRFARERARAETREAEKAARGLERRGGGVSREEKTKSEVSVLCDERKNVTT